MNPSTAELVEAVESVRSDEVIILPNNGNIRPVAERVDDLTAKAVWVVPTETVVEGFAALLAYDPEASGEVNARTMEASALKVVPGEVTRAVRDSDSRVGPDRHRRLARAVPPGHRGGGRLPGRRRPAPCWSSWSPTPTIW